jgi:hypothetical protein
VSLEIAGRDKVLGVMRYRKDGAHWVRCRLRAPLGARPDAGGLPERAAQTRRLIIIFFSSAMALAGLRPFGQALAQFSIV